MLSAMIPPQPFLLSAGLKRSSVESFDTYPFNLPAITGLQQIDFPRPVTFFVGENGAGKSTLLEAIAVKWGFNAEGGSRNYRFATRASHSSLHQHLSLARCYRKPRDGFFLRAESFYNLATAAEQLGAFHGLHEQSHGESFMTMLTERFTGHGLYLLDEPEAGLSPSRQMAMLVRMHDLVKTGSQFIIATHSPILMTYPGATVLIFDQDGIREGAYHETEHYLISRRFLENPARMLAELLDD
ncbi:MAG: ATP-binding cassette protein [Akkermansiaceae bacterium]|nr:ATP-binding cassette protein [Akkermansiaceae bacterium]